MTHQTITHRIYNACKNQNIDPTGPAEYILYYKTPNHRGETKYHGTSATNITRRLRQHYMQNVSRIILKPISANVWDQDVAGNVRAVKNKNYRNIKAGFGGLRRPVIFETELGTETAESLHEASNRTGISRRQLTLRCKEGGGFVKGIYFKFK